MSAQKHASDYSLGWPWIAVIFTENNDEFSSENLEEFREISNNKMGEKQILCQCNCQIKENEKSEIFDQPETISDIGISCSQRCSNWFRILTFMMINGKGSQYFVKILKR